VTLGPAIEPAWATARNARSRSIDRPRRTNRSANNVRSIDEAVVAGARRDAACELLGLTSRTLERWVDHGDDGRHGPKTEPANKLSEAERRKIIALATSPEFRDQSPKQIVPRLADQGRYVASEATFYRAAR
jgi:hypothetical protein